MKFTLRLVSAIWLSVMLVIGAFAYLQIREERERLVGDLQRRAMLVAEGLSDAIEAAAAKQSPTAIERIVKKFGQSQRGIAVYDRFANLKFATPDIAPVLPPSLPEVTEAIARASSTPCLSRLTTSRWARSWCCRTPRTWSGRNGTAGATTRCGSWSWRSSSRSSSRWS